MKNKLVKLEAIRGFAAVYVILHHIFRKGLVIAGYKCGWIFGFGQEAVILFFLLSGLVIKLSYDQTKNKSFGSYFSKRFLRIYIPLICVFITNYLLFCYYAHQFIDPQWSLLIKNLFMLQDAGSLKLNAISDPYLGNDPVWSLSYEWWFYMLFYLFLKVFNDKAKKVVYALSILSAITYIFYPFFLNRLFLYFSIWWTGVEIAEIYIRRESFKISNLKGALYTLSICLIILIVNAFYYTDTSLEKGIGITPLLEIRNFFSTIGLVIFGFAWKKYNWRYFNQTIGFFAVFAPFSYTLYISHYFLVIKTPYLIFINNHYLKLLIGVIICFMYSYLIELIVYPWIRSFFVKKQVHKVFGPTN